MKKIITLVLCVCLLAVSAVTAFAANDTLQIKFDTVQAQCGEQFTVKATVTDNPGFCYLKMNFSYDAEKFTLVKAENGNVSTDAFTVTDSAIVWDTGTDATATGTLVTLTFEAKTQTAGTYSVGMETVECFNYDEEDVPVSVTGGSVELTAAPCNHVFTNYVSDGNATCTADGTKTAYCDNGCGEKSTIADEGSKSAHTFTVETKSESTLKTAATCTEDAVYYLSCTCGTVSTGDTFEDADTARGHDFTLAKKDAENHWTQCSRCPEITEKTAHADADGKWETSDSEHWYTCTCGTVFDKAAHSGGTATETEKAVCEACGTAYGTADSCTHNGKKEVRNATAATCKKNGYSGDIYCKECNELIQKGHVTKATGKHDWEVVKRVNATTDKKGYIDYACKNCDAEKRVTTSYSVDTGVENILAPAAAIVLLSGAAFFGVGKLRRKEEE